MKKLLFSLLAICLFLTGCESPNSSDTNTYTMAVQLVYPDGVDAKEGIEVQLLSSLGGGFSTTTSADGHATFTIPSGLYTIRVSERRTVGDQYMAYNGSVTGIEVSKEWDHTTTVKVALLGSKSSQIVIKEFYFGGCQNNTADNSYQFDKYVTLYNNTGTEARIANLCIGSHNGNAHANKDFNEAGELNYQHETWTPLWHSIAQTKGEVVIPAYSQITIALNGGIDHTVTYTNSVNLSSVDYVVYDPEVVPNTNYHPAPSANFTVEQHMEVSLFGLGNAMMIGSVGPTLVAFELPQGMNLDEFAANDANKYYPKGNVSTFNTCMKIEKEWILDAIESFDAEHIIKSKKRTTDDLDAGAVNIDTKQGYTAYRNVDKIATEAIEGNKTKLVYGYALGTNGLTDAGTTDPSGIDAEASLKNGAVIVYLDSNNSTVDFHQRKISALK